MSKRSYIIDVVETIVGDRLKAETVIERLTDEGVLVLGYGDADVDLICESFKEYFGTTKTSRQDRFSAHRLGSKYGAQSVRGIMKLLSENSNQKFAPVVNNVAELESKFVSILKFVRNIKSDETIEV